MLTFAGIDHLGLSVTDNARVTEYLAAFQV